MVRTIRYSAKIVFTLIVKLPHAGVTRAVLIERSATHKKTSLPERREHQRTKVPSRHPRYSPDPSPSLSLTLSEFTIVGKSKRCLRARATVGVRMHAGV